MSRAPRRPLRAAALAGAVLGALAAPAAASASSPAEDYVLQCMGCHGASGAGAPGVVPSLRETPGRLLAVPGGRAFLVRVPGVAQSTLDDARLAAVLNWMLARFSPDATAAGFPRYTAAEVARLRAAPLVDVERVRRRLLDAADRAAPEPQPAALESRPPRLRGRP